MTKLQTRTSVFNSQRFDAGEISKVTQTPQGGIRVQAAVCRVGVLEYKNIDGSVRRELALPEEVFSVSSMSTLDSAPITLRHPQDMIDSQNFHMLSRGHVAEGKSRQDGHCLVAELVAQDAEIVAGILDKSLVNISCGYTCEIEETPGIWQNLKYDAIKRNIKYNHVALGPQGWGRSGADVSIRLDSPETEIETYLDTAHYTNKDKDAMKKLKQETKQDAEPSISVEEEEAVIEEVAAPDSEEENLVVEDSSDSDSLDAVLAMLDLSALSEEELAMFNELFSKATVLPEVAAEESAETEEVAVEEKTDALQIDALVSLQKRIDELEAEIVTVKAEAEAAKAESEAHLALLTEAAKLGVEVPEDATDDEIRSMVIGMAVPGMDLEGKDSDYLKAAFDMAVQILQTKEVTEVRDSSRFDNQTNNKKSDLELARQRADEAQKKAFDAGRTAWKKGL